MFAVTTRSNASAVLTGTVDFSMMILEQLACWATVRPTDSIAKVCSPPSTDSLDLGGRVHRSEDDVC